MSPARNLLEERKVVEMLDHIIKKYHYPEDERETVFSVFYGMRYHILEDAAFSYRLIDLGGGIGAEAEAKAAVVITLGEGIDRLQNEYLQKDLFVEGFMTEVIAGELLFLCYPVCNQRLKELFGLNVRKYSFLGSTADYPLTLLPDILAQSGLDLHCNSALYMEPKKSVAFIAELTQEENLICPGICTGCRSENCPNRILEEDDPAGRANDWSGIAFNYGFARIFGRNYK